MVKQNITFETIFFPPKNKIKNKQIFYSTKSQPWDPPFKVLRTTGERNRDGVQHYI